MSLKHAVLALIVERRGYGYELVQRFQERVGPGWQLNPSAVYPALDQLEREGLATGGARPGGTRRSPRIVYVATPAGAAVLDAWLRTTDAPADPVRAELHLRMAFARREHHPALTAQLAACERAYGQLLERYPHEQANPPTATSALVGVAVRARLQAELEWLGEARAALADDARAPG